LNLARSLPKLASLSIDSADSPGNREDMCGNSSMYHHQSVTSEIEAAFENMSPAKEHADSRLSISTGLCGMIHFYVGRKEDGSLEYRKKMWYE
jgi:hypothetical protein